MTSRSASTSPWWRRRRWSVATLLSTASFALVSGARRSPRRLDEDFYEAAHHAPATEIETLYATAADVDDDETPPPRADPFEYEEEKRRRSVPSTLLRVNADALVEDDLATEQSIGLTLLGDRAAGKHAVFDARPGPSELSALLETEHDDDDESNLLHRSHVFWYGERRDENGGRRLTTNATRSGHEFVPSLYLLREPRGTRGTTHEFLSASVTTEDSVVDVTTLPNGTVVMEVIRWEDLPEIDDEEPPNIHHHLIDEERLAADRDEEDRRRRLRRRVVPVPSATKDDVANDAVYPPRRSSLLQRLLVDDDDSSAPPPPVIDLLVVYTRRAMCAQAKTRLSRCDGDDPDVRAPIEARIDLAVRETNTAYLLSEVNTRVRLRHVHHEPDYDEERSFSLILGELAGRTDGQLDGVHDLRAQVGADLVVLVVENAQYCGLGYMYNGFRAFGFSVSSRKCMTGYYSFGHEIAHNMGCNHNRETSVHKEPFAHGYQSPDHKFRTIMSYNCPRGCPRINRYSSPNVLYGDAPVGSDREDNARQINKVARRVAGFYNEVETERENNEEEENQDEDDSDVGVDDRCVLPVDPFHVRLIYESDDARRDNDWFGRHHDETVDSRLSFASSKHMAAYDDPHTDAKKFDVNNKKEDDEEDPAKLFSCFVGSVRLSVSKKPNADGFENVETTAYVRWDEDDETKDRRRQRSMVEPTVILYVRSNAAADDIDGCRGHSYMASLSRTTGAVRFMKQYYRTRNNMVTSHQLVRTLPNFEKGVPDGAWVGLKFVVVNDRTDDGQDAVRLELYVDDTDGRNGGDWQKVMELTDRAGYWNAYRSWHYNYFSRSRCANTDGDLVVGGKEYSILESLGDPTTRLSLKDLSVRNVEPDVKHEIDSACANVKLRNAYNDLAKSNKARSALRPATRSPTTKPTKSPTKSPTSRPTPSPSNVSSRRPSSEHSATPTSSHSSEPTSSHSSKPTSEHSLSPSIANSQTPTVEPPCDAFGHRTIFESDPIVASNNDWVGNFASSSVATTLNRTRTMGHSFFDDGDLVLRDKSSLYVRAVDADAAFRNVEVTGYGRYVVGDGIGYRNSGLTIVVRASENNDDDGGCGASSYAATIRRDDGRAVLSKTYWRESWRSVFAVPRVVDVPSLAPILASDGSLSPDAPVGVKLVVHDLGEDRVRLRLYVDATNGHAGGDWRLVDAFFDGPDAWPVDDRNPYRRYFLESPCGERDGAALRGPTASVGVVAEGVRGTEARWRSVSVRDVTEEELERRGTCGGSERRE